MGNVFVVFGKYMFQHTEFFRLSISCKLQIVFISHSPRFSSCTLQAYTKPTNTLSLAERPTDTMRLDRGFRNNYTVQLMHSVVSIMVSFNQPALLN